MGRCASCLLKRVRCKHRLKGCCQEKRLQIKSAWAFQKRKKNCRKNRGRNLPCSWKTMENSGEEMKIKIKVKPNSGKQEIVKDNNEYIAYLKSVPEKNKANAELVNLLGKHFNKQVKIKSGFTSKNKIVEISD